jgi:GntR family transcriptional regulator
MPYNNPHDPKFQRLLLSLQDKILSGEWPPGHKLPSQTKLRDEGHDYGAIRAAFLILKARRLIEGKQGDGVFVTQPGNVAPEDMPWLSRMLGGELRVTTPAENIVHAMEQEFGKFPQMPNVVNINGKQYYAQGEAKAIPLAGRSLGV